MPRNYSGNGQLECKRMPGINSYITTGNQLFFSPTYPYPPFISFLSWAHSTQFNRKSLTFLLDEFSALLMCWTGSAADDKYLLKRHAEGLGQEHKKREAGRSFLSSWQQGPKQCKSSHTVSSPCVLFLCDVTSSQTDPAPKDVRLLDHLYKNQQEGHRRTFSPWLFCLYSSENGQIQA